MHAYVHIHAIILFLLHRQAFTGIESVTALEDVAVIASGVMASIKALIQVY